MGAATGGASGDGKGGARGGETGLSIGPSLAGELPLNIINTPSNLLQKFVASHVPFIR
jgi:hypothetical protein